MRTVVFSSTLPVKSLLLQFVATETKRAALNDTTLSLFHAVQHLSDALAPKPTRCMDRILGTSREFLLSWQMTSNGDKQSGW